MPPSPSRISSYFVSDVGALDVNANANAAESDALALWSTQRFLHRSTSAPILTMTEEAPSIRSSQGSSRRPPKNVGMPSAFRANTILSSHGSPTLTLAAVQPQQQLSQIEKSVTHLLVATKQLLGTCASPASPWANANTAKRR